MRDLINILLENMINVDLKEIQSELVTEWSYFGFTSQKQAKDVAKSAPQVIDRILKNSSNGKIKVFRVIEEEPSWDFQKETKEHEFWAWSLDGADSYEALAQENHVKWLLTAIVNVADIDWFETVCKNLSPDFKHEYELCLMRSPTPTTATIIT